MNWITIDAGNTRIKIARWEKKILIDLHHFDEIDSEGLLHFAAKHTGMPCIISSVKSDADTKALLKLFPDSVHFNSLCPIPIKNGYQQPETLGMDRLANAIAAFDIAQKDALIIDAGTCLKCDFVSANGEYIGGSISPGLSMRLQALHDYTGKLPLIDKKTVDTLHNAAIDEGNLLLLGKTTVSSCLSGVVNGMRFEMEGFIREYQNQYPELTIFLTGGDASNFDLASKNAIFANENLTLLGLLLTLQDIHA